MTLTMALDENATEYESINGDSFVNNSDIRTMCVECSNKNDKNQHKDEVTAHSVTEEDDTKEFDDLDKGWAWVVLLASFLTFCLLGNAMYTVGIIHTALLDRFGASVSLTSWAGALHTALFSLAGPLSSVVIDRFSCRTALVLSGLFFVFGYLGTAIAPSIEVAIFTCGIVAGIGGGLGYTVSMVVIGFYFKKRRNLALGVSNSGIGVGLFALAPLTQFASDFYGTTGMFIFIAGLMCHIILFGVIFFPSKLERHCKFQRNFEAIKHAEQNKNSSVLLATLRPYVHVLLNKGIFCLCLAMFGFCTGVYLLVLHLPQYMLSKGFTHAQSSYLLSIIGLSGIGGRLLTGALASWNRMDEQVLYSGSLTILAITTFIYPFYANYFVGQVIFVAMFGIFMGPPFVLTPSVSLKFVEMRYLAVSIGLEFMLGGIGALAGPVFAGILFDSTGSYNMSIVTAATCILVAAVSGAVSKCFRLPPDTLTIKVESSASEKEAKA